MAVSIFNCWACDKRLAHERGSEDYFFWCDKSCHDTYVKKTAESGRKMQEWSAYMCGEGPCPEGMEPHPMDSGLWKGKKKPIKPVKVEKALKATAKAGALKKTAKTLKKTGKKEKPNKRIRKLMEAPKRTVLCGVCGEPGHNARTCPDRE